MSVLWPLNISVSPQHISERLGILCRDNEQSCLGTLIQCLDSIIENFGTAHAFKSGEGLDGRAVKQAPGGMMSKTGVILLSDQMAMLRSVDVIANNIANSSTTGFKREGIEFNSYITEANSSKSTSYVYDRATYRDTSPGVISKTGNPLDLAIQGKGYFQIQTASGTQYTRDGAFRTDNQGQIVTSSGQPVLSDAGQPITLPSEAYDVTISGDGFITAQVGTGTTRAELGKVGVVQFANDEAVVPSETGYLTTTQTPTPAVPNDGNNVIVQGSVEESNVKPVVEITDLIRIQRAYEQATNMVSNENSRISDAIDKLSQTS